MKHQLLQVSKWKIDLLRQHFDVCYGEMTRLDQEDYYLFHYSLVYTEGFHAKR